MARVNLIICDLCKSQIENIDDIYGITLFHKEKDIEIYAELCNKCFERLVYKIDSNFNSKQLLNKSIDDDGQEVTLIKNKSKTNAVKLHSGEFKVPSVAKDVTQINEYKCSHSKIRTTSSGVICLECSEEIALEE